MISENETHMIAALEIEVGRHKKRLDSVYAEVEDLKRDKLSLSIETERIVKYNKYLEDLGDRYKAVHDKWIGFSDSEQDRTKGRIGT